MTENKKCTIIGCGFVGASTAYSLTGTGLFNELVLIDVDKKRAIGEAMDISHGLPFLAPMTVHAGEYADMAGSQVIIIAAGSGQKPGETRLSLLSRNMRIFDSIATELVKYAGDAVILVVTNPVDILTYYTLQKTGFPASRVIGSGTVLDTARLKQCLGKELQVDSRNIHAFVLGEHGDSEFPVWSSANVSGMDISHFDADEKRLQEIFEEVRDSAYTIIEGKGATYYGIAQSVKRICAAIMRNEHSVLTVSTLLSGTWGISDVCMGVPAIVGRGGVAHIFEISLSAEAEKKLQASASILKREYETTISYSV